MLFYRLYWTRVQFSSTPPKVIHGLFSSFFYLLIILFNMVNNEVSERIKEINIEDFIWVIYLVVIFLSFYSNYYERKYFLIGCFGFTEILQR